MKKVSVLIAMLVVSAFSLAQAQIIGIEGHYGKAYTSSNTDVNYDNISAHRIGLTYTHDFGDVGIKTGLMYGQKGRQVDSRILGIAGHRNITVIKYAEIPIMASIQRAYSNKVDFYVNGGAYIGRALSAVKSTRTGVLKFEVKNDTNLQIGTGTGQVRPWDAGLQVEGGVIFGNIGVGLSYQHGLLNTSNTAKELLHNRSITAHVTYRLPSTKRARYL